MGCNIQHRILVPYTANPTPNPSSSPNPTCNFLSPTRLAPLAALFPVRAFTGLFNPSPAFPPADTGTGSLSASGSPNPRALAGERIL